MWVFLALLCGLLNSFVDLLCKRILKDLTDYEVAAVRWGGAVILGEENFAERLTGSVLMFAGVLVITLLS